MGKLGRSRDTPVRAIRMGDRWERLGEEYGNRSQLFDEFAAWLLHEPGARMPRRHPERATQREAS